MPPVPPGCDVLWATFLQLHNARGSNGMGPSAISASDLVHWQQLMGIDLNPWEIEVMQALDRVALNSAAEQNAKPTS